MSTVDYITRVTMRVIVFILVCFVVWALLFGITVDDKHYEVMCSCTRGVYIAK